MENLIRYTEENAEALEREFAWLSTVLDQRFRLYFELGNQSLQELDLNPPDLSEGNSVFEKTVYDAALDFAERVILALALAPHIRPQLLDIFFTKNSTFDRGFTEFGGIKGNQHGGFIPTVETACFVLAGSQISQRFAVQNLLGAEGKLLRSGLLRVLPPSSEEPIASGQITISKEYLELFSTGKNGKPDYSSNFPARLVKANYTWEDIVLEDHVFDDVNEIRTWIKHGDLLMNEWGMSHVFKPGYRSLFYGPPGTGKTMTAALIGKEMNMDVYRIDLSMMVSKYIGETEKNLSVVFEQAESKGWLLFFDEADALFGKRTSTSSSNDRYANQQVSYLLQRIEDYPGIIILATNLKNNIDDAFVRRFQSMISFSMPGPEERLLIWQKKIPKQCTLETGLSLAEIAKEHVLSGGAITNIVRYCSLLAIDRGDLVIRQTDIESGIKKEMRKDGKIIS